MSGVLLHDGRRSGHLNWAVGAVGARISSGVIISPFSTPRVAVPRHPSGRDLAEAVAGVGGEVVFDATTHARMLPGVNKVDFYDDWELWGPSGIDLTTNARRLEHVERVFAAQSSLGAPPLAPTVPLSNVASAGVATALAMARLARGLERNAWQSMAGTRSFWSGGAQLDALVGQLAALRAPVWILTVVNELVADHVPDLADTAAFAGLYRTVHSLSQRSRVILAHSDLAGLAAVSAGADAVGSGWDRAQRTFDPNSYREDPDPGIRIPASYVTQRGLSAILRRDTAEAIERLSAPDALRLRGGVMPPSDQAQRFHHLRQLTDLVLQIEGQPDRRSRVGFLRDHYEAGGRDFDWLISRLSRNVRPADKLAWVENPYSALGAYASAEGLW